MRNFKLALIFALLAGAFGMPSATATNVISISPTSYSVNENAGTADVLIRVTRDATPAAPITVDYATMDGTAQAGSDYTSTSGTVTFGSTETAKVIHVPIIDDLVSESNETFTLMITNGQGGTVDSGNNAATITIVDNDGTTSSIQFNPTEYSIDENSGSVTLTITRTGPAAGAATVSYSTSAITASQDVDYEGVGNGTVTFAPGQTSATVTIQIFDDSDVEGNETFAVNLSEPVGQNYNLGASSSTVTIVDNETSTVNFSSSTYSVAENAGSVTITLLRNGNVNTAARVNVQTLAGNATANSDYVTTAMSLDFAQGQTSATFTIPILDDSLVEGTEFFQVSLSAQQSTGVVIGQTRLATVYILDDEPASTTAGAVQFSSANYSVLENAGSITLTVILNRTGDTNSNASVNYFTVAGSANTTRFTPTSGTITFAPGTAVATIRIPITNDSIVEPPQSFGIVLTSPMNAVLGVPSSATITIQDDDGINTVQFEQASYGAVEDTITGGNNVVGLRLRAVRGADPNQALTVELAFGPSPPDTAVPGIDYEVPPSTTVTFPPGNSSQLVAIPLIYRMGAQSGRTFTVSLTNPGSFTTVGQQGSARVAIFDDSGPNTVQFTTNFSKFREGEQQAIAIQVVRYGQFTSDPAGTTVQYTTEIRNGDTAVPGVNYITSSGTIHFNAILLDGNVVAEEQEKTIIISVPDNANIQGDATFHVTLLFADNAQFGDISTTKVTINDDDLGNVVQFSSANFSVIESGGNAVLSLNLTPNGDASRASSVDYAATGITAFGGYDFSPVTGTVTFAPGERTKTILVPINDDSLVEDAETFRVTLTNPSPGTIIGPISNAIVTIVDDDTGPNPTPTPGTASVIRFSQESYSAVTTEANVALTVKLDRAAGDTGTESFSYATQNGSAIAGQDYQESTGTLVFAPGQTQQTIIVPLLPQSTPAAGSTFTVVLSHPSTGAVIGTPSRATVVFFSPDLSTKLMNISTRGPVETGDGVMIAGFIIKGDAVEQVALRGIGSSLTARGVANAISDPTLTLVDANGNQLAFNDDYTTLLANDQQALATNGLTPEDSHESAILTSLTPGNYTAILRGKTNGIGLVEAFDISATASSHFGNISTRAKVEPSDNGAVIAGFIVSPPTGQPGTTRRVVIRAKGPSLTSAGVNGALADPTLDLYRGSQLILSNDNWKGNSTADRSELQSYGLAPTNDKESAIVTSLDPGSYSAVVRGKGNTTGVGLVEVYQVDQ